MKFCCITENVSCKTKTKWKGILTDYVHIAPNHRCVERRSICWYFTSVFASHFKLYVSKHHFVCTRFAHLEKRTKLFSNRKVNQIPQDFICSEILRQKLLEKTCLGLWNESKSQIEIIIKIPRYFFFLFR